jgi:ketosteroid isomerase-like protein
LAIFVFAAAACNSEKGDAAKAPGAAAAPKVDKSGDEAILRGFLQKAPQFAASNTVDSIAVMLADDGVEIMPGAPPAKGPEAARKLMSATFGSLKNLKMVLGDIEVHVSDSGDLAVAKAPYSFTAADAKGKPQQDHGTSLTVFKKVNGQWKMLYDTNISEVAPPQ